MAAPARVPRQRRPWHDRVQGRWRATLARPADGRPGSAMRRMARAARRPTVTGRRAFAAARHAWRRSLQLRMVTLTLVISGLLVGGFGAVVASQITEGLVRDTVSKAEKKVGDGGQVASGQLSAITDPGYPGLNTVVNSVVELLAGNPDQGSSDVTVVMEPAPDNRARVDPQSAPPSSPASLGALIPPELRDLVGRRHLVAHQFVTVAAHPYLVYGRPVPVPFGVFELYYIFSLDAEAEAASLVRTTVIATGTALVLLLALLAALTTRLVVRPVRVAAQTAQRLSAGLLDQRMEIHGEDDLARLAASFNQMAENLQRHIIRLEEMSRLQRRFTSDVSHELRTPLTTVRMAADLIFSARREFAPEVARAAELFQAELDRFEHLLSDLLEISRFDAGFAMLEAEAVDLVPIVIGAAERLRSLADRAGSPLHVKVPDAAVIAEVDARRVDRILRNLIGNAIEHGEGRDVVVRLEASQTALAVTVRDLGVGLRPGEDKLVFNRFWRSDPSRARQTGGTGLGLSISQEDARLHGGWLEAWGAPGKGAQFRLTLPLRTGDRLVASPLPLVPEDVVPEAATPPARLALTVAPDGSGDG